MASLANDAVSSDDDWENDASDEEVETTNVKTSPTLTAVESLQLLVDAFNPRTRKDHRTAGLALGIKLRTGNNNPEDVATLYKEIFTTLTSQLSLKDLEKLQKVFNQNSSSVRATLKKRKEAEEAAKPRVLSAAAQAMLAPKKKKKKKKKKKVAKSYSAFDEDIKDSRSVYDEEGEQYMEATTYKSNRSFGKGDW
jgi:hypothetical protein|tara:strand:+ start:100 stop:684 length:585 start_codon:yes stop_codon:yes gene_type:complete